MIGICRFLEFPGVACGTIRKDAILAPDKRFVTSLAFHGRMGSNQRKKILMIADLLAGSEPALHDMALGAVGAEFPQMNIGMAIGAVLSDVGEDGAGAMSPRLCGELYRSRTNSYCSSVAATWYAGTAS